MNAACRRGYAASVPRSIKLDPRNAGASTWRTKFMGYHTLLLSVSLKSINDPVRELRAIFPERCK
jgi:hypothetical protein